MTASRMLLHRLPPTAYRLLLVGLLLPAGCTDPGGTVVAPPTSAAVEAQRREVSKRLFDSAVELMNQLDDYDQVGAEGAVDQVVRRLNESLEAGALDTGSLNSDKS